MYTPSLMFGDAQDMVLNSSAYDSEFQELWTTKPRRYHPSALRTHKDEVLVRIRASQEKTTLKVEGAAIAVTKAKLDFLEEGLKADWEAMDRVCSAVALLADEDHLHQQGWLQTNEDKAEAAVNWYMEHRMKIVSVQKVSQWKAEGHNLLNHVESKHVLKRSQLYIICSFDLNCPYGRTKAKVKAVAAAVESICKDNKNRTITLLQLTDLPVKGAPKGCQSDDDTVIEEFNAVSLDDDTRFSMWTERKVVRPSDRTGARMNALTRTRAHACTCVTSCRHPKSARHMTKPHTA
jgi:hypothetical protein